MPYHADCVLKFMQITQELNLYNVIPEPPVSHAKYSAFLQHFQALRDIQTLKLTWDLPLDYIFVCSFVRFEPVWAFLFVCPGYQFLTAAAFCFPTMILYNAVRCHLHLSCPWHSLPLATTKNVGPKMLLWGTPFRFTALSAHLLKICSSIVRKPFI